MQGLAPLAAQCAELWGLRLEEPFASEASFVVPAGEVVLKLNAAWHFEAEHEADALALWDGRGAIRLLARDDERRALLIERCRPGTQLWDSAKLPHAVNVDQIAVACGLVERLRVEAPDGHPFRLLADEADRWAEKPYPGVPAEVRNYALDVFRSVDRTARRLVNQDLHGGNILAAEREPWLAIDPKPLVGEPELDGAGLLRNAADPSPWLDALAALGLDRERLRGWGVAHALAWNNVEEAERILRAR